MNSDLSSARRCALRGKHYMKIDFTFSGLQQYRDEEYSMKCDECEYETKHKDITNNSYI